MWWCRWWRWWMSLNFLMRAALITRSEVCSWNQAVSTLSTSRWKLRKRFTWIRDQHYHNVNTWQWLISFWGYCGVFKWHPRYRTRGDILFKLTVDPPFHFNLHYNLPYKLNYVYVYTIFAITICRFWTYQFRSKQNFSGTKLLFHRWECWHWRSLTNTNTNTITGRPKKVTL